MIKKYLFCNAEVKTEISYFNNRETKNLVKDQINEVFCLFKDKLSANPDVERIFCRACTLIVNRNDVIIGRAQFDRRSFAHIVAADVNRNAATA